MAKTYSSLYFVAVEAPRGILVRLLLADILSCMEVIELTWIGYNGSERILWYPKWKVIRTCVKKLWAGCGQAKAHKEAYDLQLGLLHSWLHFYSSYPCRIPNLYLAQA